MSHITTVDCKIKPKDEGMIKAAITFMAKEFSGMTFEQVAPDVIKLRYKAIEGYQTNGNVQFVKNPETGVWDMQLDPWRCDAEVQKVKEAFFVAYQAMPTIQQLNMTGYTVTQERKGKNLVLTATKY
jgi:hypothetical protein